MPLFNFPSQELVTRLVDKHSFDPAYFVTPKFMPVDADTCNNSPALVMWDVLEPTRGMTKLSALGADPVLVPRRVRETKMAAPLYWRESMEIGEKELINARRLGTNFERAGEMLVTDAVFSLNRRIDTLIERLNFEALSGSISEVDANGATVSVDYGFNPKNLPDVKNDAGYGGYYWSDATNATVIDDIYKAVEALAGSGYTAIKMIAGREVMAMIAKNAQVKGLLAGSAFVNQIGTSNLVQFLPQLIGAGIDEIIPSTQYYQEDNGDPKPFADANKCYLIGTAPGQQLGAFMSTPNIYGEIGEGAKGGRFAKINYHEFDSEIPRVTVTGGIFGLPVLYRPDMVVTMTVAE